MPAVANVSATSYAAPVPTPWMPPSTMYSVAENMSTEWPRCAVPCLEQHCALLSDSDSSSCLCAIDTKRAIDHCILGSCGMPEAIFSRNLTETTCKTPVRSRNGELKTMILAVTPFTVFFVSLRITYKLFFTASRCPNREEWTLLAAIVAGLAALGVIFFGVTANGMGTDVWGLDLATLISFRRHFVVAQICYVVLMLLLKLTYSLFYLNIFLGRRIRALIWATICVHVAITAACTLVVILQCVPLDYQWNKFENIHDDSMSGHCININAAAWVNSIFSCTSDLWLLAIPMSQLHKLNLHWKKKVGAALMFGTGASVTVVSFLRLASVRYYASTSNPTWDQWGIMYWSTVEIELGFICSSLPTIRLLLVRLAPGVFGSASNNPP
ncbi:CFEM domain-containing protein [Cordyceps javanica]|uniref:CFEM domain-containing protein n=1 Tax=Cordyceps javanica TaxID=43265 RepID=A0A545UMF2_9HYPO|nr:CFEM domain-containing protein [Cordyceps javanica]TQW02080.1 CFEM domain-containing protein [Cordyceps javanica]